MMVKNLIYALAASFFFMALSGNADAGLKRYIIGNREDVSPPLHGPVLNLAGGSTDLDESMQWMIDEARGCKDCAAKVDIVVLRASGADGYNDYLYSMTGVDSVETIILKSRELANRIDLANTVENAEVVFFAGGDQCNYVRYFRGTRIHKAVEEVYKKGGAVGGTSAGCAIMGQFTFDACTDTVKSEEALNNPYRRNVTLTREFFRWKFMNNTITDQHFVARDRMGRLLVFLARLIQDGAADSILGIAVEEKTAVVVDRSGMAKVMGAGPAYFILADHKPEICRKGAPLTYSNYKFWKINSGGSFNLKDRPASGYYVRSVVEGKLNSNPYAP